MMVLKRVVITTENRTLSKIVGFLELRILSTFSSSKFSSISDSMSLLTEDISSLIFSYKGSDFISSNSLPTILALHNGQFSFFLNIQLYKHSL